MKKPETKKPLEILIKQLDHFADCEIKLVKTGHNRTIYHLKTKNNENFIAKLGNERKDSGSNFVNEIISQEFINHMGLDFVPKIVHFDEINDLHIETCVGDKNIICNELNNDEIDMFAKQLFSIHDLPVEKYYKFCSDRKFKTPKLLSPIDNLNSSGFERFEIVQELCPDEYAVAWIETNLCQSMIDISNKPVPEPHLNWGDIGENLRRDNSKLYFIDWEFSKLSYGTELAYIKIHSHLSPEKFDYLVSRYSFHSGKTIDELQNEIIDTEKIIRINDVVWAAMKWGQSKSAEDIAKYKALTYKRMDLAENI